MEVIAIAVAAAGAVALLTAQAYARLTYPRRLVSARINQTAGLSFNATSVLRANRSGRFGFLPLSPAAGARMGQELAQAAWSIRVEEYVALRLLIACAAGIGAHLLLPLLGVEPIGLRIVLTLPIMFAGWLLPRLYLSHRRKRRLEQIEKQLPDALTAMAKALRAGSGLLQALTYAANETPAPLGTELQSTVRDLQLGAEAADVFGALVERAPSPDLDIAVTAIVIQRTVGGNLSEILTNVTNTIRERAYLKREVQVLTARQRLTSNVVAAIPVCVAVAFVIINPTLGNLLTQTLPGQISLGAGITLELFGIWLIRRLGMIDV